MSNRSVSFADGETQSLSNQPMICPNCGGRAIEHHEASGASICTECGIVVEENAIVSSVEFIEGAGGSSSMVGQFVSASSSKAYTARRYGFSRDSRETTLANGRRRIQEVASRLRLATHFVDAAHRLYTIAVEKNFVQGRRSAHVVAACLYIACRQEKSQHMLIDFSDALQVNVYTLGTCFLKFRRLLGLKLEIIDPALFVYRFAAHLDLDAKANAVSLTALRLVARMKRDWIVAGRRPAGICAAALLIASRAHGFSKHHQDVTRILKICGLTVRNRVKEFEHTPTAQLTLEQFHTVELQREVDPPAFARNRILEARARAIEEGNVALLTSGALDDPLRSGKRAAQWRHAKKQRKSQSGFRHMYDSLEKELATNSNEQITELPEAGIEGDTGKHAYDSHPLPENQLEIVKKDAYPDHSELIEWKNAYPRGPKGKAIILPDHFTIEEIQPSTTPVEAKLNLIEWKQDMPATIDDEIDALFRSDQEQRQMELIFNKINKDYLVQQERKESERHEGVDKDDGRNKLNRKRKGSSSNQTTEEQLMAAVSNRKVSRKINYDALSSIFDDNGSFSTDVVADEGANADDPEMYAMF